MADVMLGAHDFVVVDVETTGLYWRRDRVVSVAVARCDKTGRPVDQWYSLVNPECPMGASEIHGLTDQSVAHAPRFEDIADELLAQLGGAVLIGHNVTFDWRFLSNEYARNGETLPEHDAICTMAMARALHLNTEDAKLDTIAAYCEVELPRARFHNAQEDVLATAGIFSLLYPLALKRGIDPVVHLTPVAPPTLRKTTKCDFVNPGPAESGRPLVQGMHVVMTGETSTPREDLFARSLAAGLDVMSAVNSKTSLLVANDINSGTAKAKTAIALGIPVLDEESYLHLLSSVAPGTPRQQLVERASARKAARARPSGTEALAVTSSGPLAGRRVMLLGKIDDQEHLEELVAHSGGIVSHNVSKNTSLVVLGSQYDSARLSNAVDYGAEVISPAELLSRLHAGEDLASSEHDHAVAEAEEAETSHEPEFQGMPSVIVEVPEKATDSELPPPAWHPDPYGRFQYRFWDGVRWGPYVSTNGQAYLDLLS
jgi:DNA polymerase-3 subunit epsilon